MTETVDIFSTMRASYLDRLGDKLNSIEEDAIQAISNEGAPDLHFTTLYGSLHKLIGSAGIYGFDEVANAAIRFIDWVRPLSKAPHPLNSEQQVEAITLLNGLKAACANCMEPVA